MKLIDTHCHLNFKSFSGDFIAVAQESLAKNVEAVVIPGSQAISSAWKIEVCNSINAKIGRKYAYGALGIHPHHLNEADKFSIIEELSNDESIVAIGECGLDFHIDIQKATLADQADLFARHIELANKRNLPIIIHNRQSDEEILNVLGQFERLPKMVFHCFSSDWKFAEKVLSMGAFISFTGNITYGNKKLKKAVERIPIERVMIETDSPYIVPEPDRASGISRNEPYLVERVLQKIASIKEADADDIAKVIYQNSKKFFNLDFDVER
jgi:TatD DNase family protein